mmetsp:Transcript_28790/g.89588  ORF Transcript_28790/g.89588 Transcript_28790/m.89588 type:complete len:519 (+) Transcript_28790:872-2428(+)
MPTRSKYGIPVEFAKPPVSKADKKAAAAKKKAAKAEKDAQRAREEAEEEEMDEEEREAAEAAAREAEERKDTEKRLQVAKTKAQRAISKHEWVEALKHYSECIELEPDDHLNWSNRAAAHQQLGLFEEMLADAAKSTEVKPDYVKGWWRIGQANLHLENLDEAEEALRRGLELDPENANCLECFASVEQAKAAEQEADDYDILLKELKALDPTQLHERALAAGLLQDKVDEAEGREDPKEAMVSLIVAHKYLVNLIESDLQGLDLDQLCERALEEGMDQSSISEITSRDEPEKTLTAEIINFLSNDLVGTARAVQDEAEYEEAPDDEEDAGIAFEIVTFDMDENNLQLAEGDVFLAGAYIDDKFGELVLPSGARLGNRALHKYYKQRARPNRELACLQRTHSLASRVQAKMAQREAWRTNNSILLRGASYAKGSSNALASQAMRKQKEADNKAMRAIVHHWGGGGGGSHYHSCGGKQYNQGNKVKGVILRHSRQGAKLQAQRVRNSANRANKSVACLK